MVELVKKLEQPQGQKALEASTRMAITTAALQYRDRSNSSVSQPTACLVVADANLNKDNVVATFEHCKNVENTLCFCCFHVMFTIAV